MSNGTNAKTAKSLTDRTSLGNKAISVALSVVLLGFGWPTTSLSKAYAEDAASETAQVESTAVTDQPTADTAVEVPAASEGSATQPATGADSDSSTADGVCGNRCGRNLRFGRIGRFWHDRGRNSARGLDGRRRHGFGFAVARQCIHRVQQPDYRPSFAKRYRSQHGRLRVHRFPRHGL